MPAMRTADLVRLSTARRLASNGEGRRLREAAGLTRAEVAATCGVTAVTIWRWENGHRSPHGVPALKYEHLLSALASTIRQPA